MTIYLLEIKTKTIYLITFCVLIYILILYVTYMIHFYTLLHIPFLAAYANKLARNIKIVLNRIHHRTQKQY